MYEIQVKTKHGWSSDQIGANNQFVSEIEAMAAISQLKKLGGQWAKATYRVVAV
jgi:hypothetical protein